MEHFIYVINPTRPEMLTTGPTGQEAGLLEQHFLYLQNLTEQGEAVFVGRTLNTDASAFGMVVYKAQSTDHAREIMEADPAVSGGVMTAQYFPYKIIMHSQIEI